jgi:hypothetical protein
MCNMANSIANGLESYDDYVSGRRLPRSGRAVVRPQAGSICQQHLEDVMEALLPIIIQLISGAVGGNAAGALLKNLSLGTVGNSIAGILGGGLAGQFLGPMLGMATGGGDMSLGGIVSEVATGGVGGGALMAIIGLLRSMFAK